MTDLETSINTARSLHGRLLLQFAKYGDRTVVMCAERSPPFHLQRLLYLESCRPGLAQAAILNTTAGLCSGDRLELTIKVQSGAAVEVTTPTSTRVFGMDDGTAESRTSIVVEPGGYLEYVPRPTILCRDASLQLRIRATVGRGGKAAIGDVLAFGRAAAGERHVYRRLDTRTELHYDGTLGLAEALRLGREDCPDATGVLGDAAVYGTLHLIGIESEVPAFIAHVRQMIEAQSHVVGGISTMHAGAGVAVRLLGDRSYAMHEALRAITIEFRRRYLL